MKAVIYARYSSDNQREESKQEVVVILKCYSCNKYPRMNATRWASSRRVRGLSK